jgi:iron complex transport system substrate-binding protein
MKNLLRLTILYFLIFFLVCISSFAQYKRIISLTPSITQELYFLGEEENVVGITSFCKKISDKQQIVGTYLQPNIEKILDLNPDIIFLSQEGMSKDVVEQFKRFNLNYVVLEPVNTYEELKTQVVTISNILNKNSLALSKISYLEKKYFTQNPVKKKLKSIFIIDSDLLIVSSTTSYIGEILSYAGLENLVKTKKRYPQLSIEEITKLDPEVIIVTDMGMKKNKVKKYFKKFPWLQAVKNDKIIVVDSNIFCQPTIENFWISVEKIKSIINNEK